ncbi:helix-turn-helix domain-containing protein [Streptomyces sp. NPDC004296]|uniref:helix-turn-helix domain-containing protein n=1 Tax=Streptomyces sp. NPDC004296 TaxID=3364697 RepID=UPI0036C7CD1B
MTEISAALRGNVRSSIARGAGRIEAVDADPAEWERVIGETLVDLELLRPTARQFRGTLTTRGAVDILLSDIAASACRGTTGREAGGMAPEYIFCHQVSGHGIIVQDGRTVTLSAGGLAVYAAHREAAIVFRDEFRAVSLHVPGHLLDVPNTALDEMTARDLTKPASGPVFALGEYLRWMNGAMDSARSESRGRMVLTAVDLISSVAREWMGHDAATSVARTGPSRRAEMLDFIERNLGATTLGPVSIANAHYVSVRYVHTLFQDYGETVGAYIRARRLAKCARDLADPSLTHLSVAAIGRRWGFESAPHFSELFRRAYDESPSGYRRRHVGFTV